MINKLIETGIMKYLSDNYFTKKSVYEKNAVGPKVLTMDDVEIGFKLWLGFCAISSAVFVMEIIFKMKQIHSSKTKFAKIHPQEDSGRKYECNFRKETLEKFKIRSNSTLNATNNAFKTIRKTLRPSKSL